MFARHFLCLICICELVCSHENETKKALPQVQIVSVVEQNLQLRIPIVGTLAPPVGHDVKVGSLTAGRVEKIFAGEGDHVKKGDILARIETQLARDKVSQARAQIEQAKAALVNAHERYSRVESMYEQHATSKQALEDVHAQLVAAQSALKQAQAQGGSADFELDRTTLRSPFDGVVAAILIPAGQPVEGNATPVVEVVDTHQLELRAPVSASRVNSVEINQKVELHVDGDVQIVGTVFAISPIIDTVTNTVTVRIKIENSEGKLRGGLFARGFILSGFHHGIEVPLTALLPDDAGDATRLALLSTDNKIEQRDVSLGNDTGDEKIEVRSGLRVGDRVVVHGAYGLPSGVLVEVVP